MKIKIFQLHFFTYILIVYWGLMLFKRKLIKSRLFINFVILNITNQINLNLITKISFEMSKFGDDEQ